MATEAATEVTARDLLEDSTQRKVDQALVALLLADTTIEVVVVAAAATTEWLRPDTEVEKVDILIGSLSDNRSHTIMS